MKMQRLGLKRTIFLGTSLLLLVSSLYIWRIWESKTSGSHSTSSHSTRSHSTPSFKEYQERFAHVRPTRIPKIIHQIWNEELIPDQFVRNIQSLVKYNQHPEWQYSFCTLNQGREFVKRKFPKLLPIYDGSPKLTKADILRFLLIYHYGGVYFDLDIFCVRSLDRFVEQHECALSGPTPEYAVAYDYKLDPIRVNNAIYVCRPNHPFFKLLISRTEDYSKSCSNTSCPMPEHPFPVLTYLNEYGPKDTMPDIIDRDLLEPIYDLTVTGLLEKKCSDGEYNKLELEKKRVCDNWKQSGKDKKLIPEISYAVHTWFHIGLNNVTTLLNLTISDIVPHVKILRFDSKDNRLSNCC